MFYLRRAAVQLMMTVTGRRCIPPDVLGQANEQPLSVRGHADLWSSQLISSGGLKTPGDETQFELTDVAQAFKPASDAGLKPCATRATSRRAAPYVRVAGATFRRTVIMTSTPNRISVPKKYGEVAS
jgi:hypothetical protein